MAGWVVAPASAQIDPVGEAMGDPPERSVLMVASADGVPISIEWPTVSGVPRRHERTLPFAALSDKIAFGDNLEAYLASGGTRLDRGQGHPDGTIVRVGFYKANARAPFFDDIADEGVLELQVGPVRFNQPVRVPPGAILQHVQFTEEELRSCGLPGANRNCFNTSDPRDTHTGRLSDEDSRRGALHVRTLGGAPLAGEAPPTVGETPEHWLTERGEVVVEHDEDGGVILVARLPYSMLRHVRDPWLVTAPGTFQEPSHFHVEFEVTPEWAEPRAPNTGRPPPMGPAKLPPESER
ncbi:MAG: hypothetical protein AAGK04_02630 [Planctomycetota bacterium]